MTQRFTYFSIGLIAISGLLQACSNGNQDAESTADDNAPTPISLAPRTPAPTGATVIIVPRLALRFLRCTPIVLARKKLLSLFDAPLRC